MATLVNMFVEDEIQDAPGTPPLLLTDLYNRYKSWHLSTFWERTRLTKNEFKRNLDIMWDRTYSNKRFRAIADIFDLEEIGEIRETRKVTNI